MTHHIEARQEQDGRWVAKVSEIPGLVVYGHTQTETVVEAHKLAAILLPGGSKGGGRILAFYPGSVPDSARRAAEQSTAN